MDTKIKTLVKNNYQSIVLLIGLLTVFYCLSNFYIMNTSQQWIIILQIAVMIVFPLFFYGVYKITRIEEKTQKMEKNIYEKL